MVDNYDNCNPAKKIILKCWLRIFSFIVRLLILNFKFKKIIYLLSFIFYTLLVWLLILGLVLLIGGILILV